MHASAASHGQHHTSCTRPSSYTRYGVASSATAASAPSAASPVTARTSRNAAHPSRASPSSSTRLYAPIGEAPASRNTRATTAIAGICSVKLSTSGCGKNWYPASSSAGRCSRLEENVSSCAALSSASYHHDAVTTRSPRCRASGHVQASARHAHPTSGSARAPARPTRDLSGIGSWYGGAGAIVHAPAHRPGRTLYAPAEIKSEELRVKSERQG